MWYTCVIVSSLNDIRVRYWSLITGRGGGGGATKWEGGHVKFYPYERGGGGAVKSYSHAEGGAQQVLG